MFVFGSGALIGTPNNVANPTPINFGLVQEVTVDENVNLKELFGQFQRPIAVGAGTRKTTGKAKAARVSGLALASLYYGVTPQSGQTTTAFGEAGAVPATSAYTITAANVTGWTADLGVIYAGTGLPLKRVPSAPAAGQYSVSVGIYTFAAADAGQLVLLSYNYNTPAGSGQKIPIVNTLIGQTISFGLNLYGLDPTSGASYSLQLYNNVCSKFGFGTKLEDFVMPDFEWTSYANAAGALGQWNFGDAA